MVAIAATNSASPPPQLALARTRLDQAQREAAQAEQTARNLRSQADDAEQQAQKSDARVQTLSSDVLKQSGAERNPTYSAPSKAQPEAQAKPPTETPPAAQAFLGQTFLGQVYKERTERRPSDGKAVLTNATGNTVRNTLGQETGRLVNLTA